ncbi:hypothetical protein, partial [Desulfobacula sp.]
TANLLSHTQIVLAGTSGYARFKKKGQLNKTGIFGFEADVHFSDPGVKWVAMLLTFACQIILKSMSKNHSPIFWKNEDSKISQKANDYLVGLSFKLIDQAGENQENLRQENIKHRKEKILARINSIIKRQGYH